MKRRSQLGKGKHRTSLQVIPSQRTPSPGDKGRERPTRTVLALFSRFPQKIL